MMMNESNVKGFLKRGGVAACVTVLLWPAVLFSDASPAADSPKTFSTSNEAAQALLKASEANDLGALLQLFAPNGKELLITGDTAGDAQARARFTDLAHKKMVLAPDPADPNKIFILAGDRDWPFPVPLIQKNGLWMFDSSEGKKEVLARYIGAHELSAIDICRGYVAAQNQYAQTHLHKGVPEYAQKLGSSSVRQDGLYWKPKHGELPSPVPADFAKAAHDMKPSRRKPYHGYYFRILKAQGPDAHGGAKNYIVDGAMTAGFGLVAWPAQYAESGVQTLIVNQEGVVYQTDLGLETDKIAPALTQFNPDPSWTKVKAE
jgi:hypothetical protein